MDGFALSERWCGWTDVDVIFTAARARAADDAAQAALGGHFGKTADAAACRRVPGTR